MFTGMKVYKEGITDFATKLDVLESAWKDHDFFFFPLQAYRFRRGEDGDFDRKVACIEEVEPCRLPRMLALNPRRHRHHRRPFHSGGISRRIPGTRCRCSFRASLYVPILPTAFGETACITGGLGRFPAMYLMNELLAARRKDHKVRRVKTLLTPLNPPSLTRR